MFNWQFILRQIWFSFQSDCADYICLSGKFFKSYQSNQSSKTATEGTSMTYKNAFTKQIQGLNRGGIVEGLGLYQQSSETPTNTTKLLI